MVMLQVEGRDRWLAFLRTHLEGDERGISAGLVLERDGLEMALPCHPADTVALAVRAGKPIMAHDSALAHARSAPVSNPGDAEGEPPATALDAVEALARSGLSRRLRRRPRALILWLRRAAVQCTSTGRP